MCVAIAHGGIPAPDLTAKPNERGPSGWLLSIRGGVNSRGSVFVLSLRRSEWSLGVCLSCLGAGG